MKLIFKTTILSICFLLFSQSVHAVEKNENTFLQKNETFFITVSKPIYFNGYTQVRYQFQQDKKDGFDIRRARMSLKGKLGKQLGYKLQAEFGGSNPKLLDTELTFDLHRAAKFSAGQFKIPFSQENLTSSSKLETINRSQVVESLTARGKDVIGNQNGRDIGFQLSGSFGKTAKTTLIDYAVGIFNGSGINTSDLNEEKDAAGRFVLHPFGHLSVGGSYYVGHYTLFNTPDQTDGRNRIGAEFAFSCSSFSLLSEYIQGKDASVEKSGWYIQSGYFIISEKLQAIVKYDTYDPNIDLPDNIGTVFTIGANIYFDDQSKLQINYELKNEQEVDSKNDALTVQLQVGF